MNYKLLTNAICLISINIYSNLDIQNMELNADQLLSELHSKLNLNHGSFSEEYPEQKMAVMFIKPDDVVLELGGNIGRNSCIIASILKDSKNLVVVESDPHSAKLLEENKTLNNLNLNIENSAISKRPLIQSAWNTVPSDVVLAGYYKVNTISYDEIKNKYNKQFNTLVADCEGALYYILQDDENLIDDFKTIIVENDYSNMNHFNDVKGKFIKHGFKLVYNRPLNVPFPTGENFFQVWQK